MQSPIPSYMTMYNDISDNSDGPIRMENFKINIIKFMGFLVCLFVFLSWSKIYEAEAIPFLTLPQPPPFPRGLRSMSNTHWLNYFPFIISSQTSALQQMSHCLKLISYDVCATLMPLGTENTHTNDIVQRKGISSIDVHNVFDVMTYKLHFV